MNKLTRAERSQIISLLCEGGSLRSISRVTGIAFNTVMKLLVDAGKVCEAFHDETVHNVKAKRVQCDEVWSFVYAKKRNVAEAKSAPEGAGDCWTWTAIDPDTKLIISFLVGRRDAECAHAFMQDVVARLANQVQLTTDAFRAYLDAVEDAFGGDVDYEKLVNLCGDGPASPGRYTPAICTGTRKERMMGSPDPAHISTSHFERQNSTMRMSMRRFTHLTNGFRKSAENHAYAVALHFVYYNFARYHQTLRCSPAMAAGLTNKLWDISDIVALVEKAEMAQVPAKRGPYKPRQPKVAPEISN